MRQNETADVQQGSVSHDSMAQYESLLGKLMEMLNTWSFISESHQIYPRY